MAIGKTKYWQICSILKLIYQNPGITRKELSNLLCIDKAMITHIVNYLTADEWLIKQNHFAKKIPLSLNENRLYVAGIEIQPEYQRLAVCNINGTILYRMMPIVLLMELGSRFTSSAICFLRQQSMLWLKWGIVHLSGI